MGTKNLKELFVILMSIDDKKHVENVSKLSILIGRQLGLEDKELMVLRDIALLHDLGKVELNPLILHKTSRLTEEEYKHVKRHCEMGYELFNKNSEGIAAAAEISLPLLQHHERVDGKGYPKGLSRDEITIQSKIIAVADVFDALVSNRPYKKGWPCEEAYSYMMDMSGLMFDEEVVDAFSKVYCDVKALY